MPHQCRDWCCVEYCSGCGESLYRHEAIEIDGEFYCGEHCLVNVAPLNRKVSQLKQTLCQELVRAGITDVNAQAEICNTVEKYRREIKKG